MNAKTKTVFISGSSSGIGLETALLFHEQGWNVVATMRHPEKRQTPLHEKGLPHLVHMDVMDKDSIKAAVRYAVETCGEIDPLVNIAGFAVYGPFEAVSQEQLACQFNTNVFGLMDVTRELIPIFRKQGRGVILNVSSVGGQTGFPLYTVYNSTKWAVEGFSEALRYELKPLNIKVRLIEPGIILTDFYTRSMEKVDCTGLEEAYGASLHKVDDRLTDEGLKGGSSPRLVAETIFRAANDKSWRLRYRAGSDARLVSAARWLLPQALFFKMLEKQF
jgi:NAD(P)-dependent dehydrogenase (short-subunit alcohol dehydrogenase family)